MLGLLRLLLPVLLLGLVGSGCQGVATGTGTIDSPGGGGPSGGGGGTVTPGGGTTSPPYPDKPLVSARSARAFGDSVGVNVRLTHLDTSYGDFETVFARLRELGVRRVFDGLCPTCEYQIDRLNRLAGAGIKADLNVGTLRQGSTYMQASLRAIRDRLRASAAAVVAPNEPDIQGDANWIEGIRAYQAELNLRVKSDPALAHLSVMGPIPVWENNRTALGDLSAHLDEGNIHPYPGGNPPFEHLDREKLFAAAISGTKPIVITEIGYHGDMTTSDPHHRQASERAASVYTPRIALEAFRSGIPRTHFYQLADLWSDAEARSRNFSKFENSFGLLRWDLSPKPAFLTLRNLLRTVDSGSAAVGAPGGLRYGLEGAGSDVRQLLLRSADGSYALVLWRDVSVWDRMGLRDLSPAADQLDVVLGQPIGLARRFDPVASDSERERWTDPRRIPVALAGEPVVLRLTP